MYVRRVAVKKAASFIGWEGGGPSALQGQRLDLLAERQQGHSRRREARAGGTLLLRRHSSLQVGRDEERE